MRVRSLALFALLIAGLVRADDLTQVRPAGEKSKDTRLGPVKTLNDYFPFTPPTSKDEWAKRKEAVREQLMVANGIWPLPVKSKFEPIVTGKIERPGYTIEKVAFASLPGHYVTGNLYRPTGKVEGKRPGVLCPHGHWANGRFYEAPDADVEKQLKSKAETTREGAKYPLQARCANLAMMGFVVFHYDMVGYADSTAIPHREGFRDVEAELRLQSFMGLQTWNSIRALDYLVSLPEVDSSKIGVTGASGGGTQTFILGGIDYRPAAAFPAVMVSTAMQGGCVCENCSYLRLGTGNIELAGLFAPKPMAMSGADDWTKEIMTKGYPELKKLYAVLGAESNVAAQAWTQFPHNYNQPAREFMYTWFAKHLQGKEGAVAEKPFVPVPPKELAVFDASHPRPQDEVPAAKLRQTMTSMSNEWMETLVPKDDATLTEFRRVYGTAWRVMVDGGVPATGTVTVDGFQSVKGPGDVTIHKAILGRKGAGDAVPAIGVIPEGFDGKVVVWVHPKGKASLMEKDDWVPEVKAILAQKQAVFAIDVLRTGEQAGPPLPVGKPMYGNVFAGYVYGYNRSTLADRVRDVLTAVANLRDNAKAKSIRVVGWGDMGPVAAIAQGVGGSAIQRTAADLNGFRFEGITSLDDAMMLPGAVKYGGVPGALALAAPAEVMAFGAGENFDKKLPLATYKAAKATDKLILESGKTDPAKVVTWLTR